MSVLAILFHIYFLTEVVHAGGFLSWCHVNATLFVPEGDSTTFRLISDNVNYTHIRFSKGVNSSRVSIYAHVDDPSNWTKLTVHFLDKHLENRTTVTGLRYGTKGRVNIVMSNLSELDNGFYIFRSDINYCYQLYVMNIWGDKKEITETTGVYVQASPSLPDISHDNITVTWLLAGCDEQQSSNFILLDSKIWIPNVSRKLNEQNVTYRIQESTGAIHDVNYTLNVTYGPQVPLNLSPEPTYYFLTSGQSMSDVTCTVDCNPKCLVNWMNQSSGNILHLGQVNVSSTAMYTCRATSPTDGRFVDQNLLIFVKDEPDWPIQIKPNRTTYVVSDGDVIPDIQCSSVCDPPCKVTWGVQSITDTLSLGKATQHSTGQYTCIVTRQGSHRRMEKGITVIVTANDRIEKKLNNTIVVFAVLLSLSIFGIILITVCLYVRSVKPGCIPGMKEQLRYKKHSVSDEVSIITYKHSGQTGDHVDLTTPSIHDNQGSEQSI